MLWFPFRAAYVFVSLQMWSMSLSVLKSSNEVTRESCRSRTGSGKIHRLKSSAFWISLCCHRFTWTSFTSFAFFLASSLPFPTFLKAFLFLTQCQNNEIHQDLSLLGLSFVRHGLQLSLHLSPQVTQEQEVDFHLDYQYLDRLRHLNQRHYYFHLNQ